MSFNGFSKKDFDVFTIDGLEPRMEAIKEQVRPKLEDLGEHFAAWFTKRTGEEMYPHVAKHARRKVNPPDDTWVAIAESKRGYKKLPHFQIGLWETHVFVWFAVIYESPIKQDFAKALKEQKEEITSNIPNTFVWSLDHTKPEVKKQSELSSEDFDQMFDRLENVKKAEILCGIQLSNDSDVVSDSEKFIQTVEQAFETLMPLYQIAKRVGE
ncbi:MULTISPECIES: YktB family protein [Alteribacter]|uniref:UPF0637 protein EBO34_07585 n=1 Tax=Alteribacter keqinensis TaxID=2483800 RepID=A0A3M7TVZ1_9BACI|nr:MULTISPECIES: DUF1054 domain-containing protein [Alteribacter]MBM7095969.1 DUF1054 domain-containing protein [Alteribacter salitolerans]RNA69787.1 DUF1054 domain-containing protein [Alteribacter keqinensis]